MSINLFNLFGEGIKNLVHLVSCLDFHLKVLLVVLLDNAYNLLCILLAKVFCIPGIFLSSECLSVGPETEALFIPEIEGISLWDLYRLNIQDFFISLVGFYLLPGVIVFLFELTELLEGSLCSDVLIHESVTLSFFDILVESCLLFFYAQDQLLNIGILLLYSICFSCL